MATPISLDLPYRQQWQTGSNVVSQTGYSNLVSQKLSPETWPNKPSNAFFSSGNDQIDFTENEEFPWALSASSVNLNNDDIPIRTYSNILTIRHDFSKSDSKPCKPTPSPKTKIQQADPYTARVQISSAAISGSVTSSVAPQNGFVARADNRYDANLTRLQEEKQQSKGSEDFRRGKIDPEYENHQDYAWNSSDRGLSLAVNLPKINSLRERPPAVAPKMFSNGNTVGCRSEENNGLHVLSGDLTQNCDETWDGYEIPANLDKTKVEETWDGYEIPANLNRMKVTGKTNNYVHVSQNNGKVEEFNKYCFYPENNYENSQTGGVLFNNEPPKGVVFGGSTGNSCAAFVIPMEQPKIELSELPGKDISDYGNSFQKGFGESKKETRLPKESGVKSSPNDRIIREISGISFLTADGDSARVSSTSKTFSPVTDKARTGFAENLVIPPSSHRRSSEDSSIAQCSRFLIKPKSSTPQQTPFNSSKDFQLSNKLESPYYGQQGLASREFKHSFPGRSSSNVSDLTQNRLMKETSEVDLSRVTTNMLTELDKSDAKQSSIRGRTKLESGSLRWKDRKSTFDEKQMISDAFQFLDDWE